jgi:hypothetical protein
VSLSPVIVVGFLLGFAFGVGCALAVMYSIYLGGYRAAVRDARLPVAPERLTHAVAALDKEAFAKLPNHP